MTVITDRYERELLARTSLEGLPHRGRDAVAMQVQCPEGHHLLKVLSTGAGPIVVTTVRAHSHGNRDRPDEPHTPAKAREFVDMLAVADPAEDEIPAWCDCGHRTLSRAAVAQWLAGGEKRVVIG